MKIWDLPTRLYHWLQAALFVGLAASGFNGQGPHIYLGLALFSLLIWRIIWGVVGSDTSRFAQFISSPAKIIRYLSGKESTKQGHNPLGAWMVVAMITVLTLQCLSGIVIAGLLDNLVGQWLTDEVFNAIVTLHIIAARALVAFVALHLLAIIIYKMRSKPLVWAMISGRKTMDSTDIHGNAGDVLHFASNRKAFVVLIAAVLVTMTIVVVSLF